ncbi:MAG: hypothetical protein LUD52_05115 [Opitutae bacterium]|nr:hypothetical protein [Opitutae bacterium]
MWGKIMPSMFSRKKESPAEREAKLARAWEYAPIRATMQLARGNVNLSLGRFSTQEQIDAQLKSASESFLKLKH